MEHVTQPNLAVTIDTKAAVVFPAGFARPFEALGAPLAIVVKITLLFNSGKGSIDTLAICRLDVE